MKTKQLMKIELIDEPWPPMRMEMDPEKIRELAESIRAMGQLQPILLVKRGERYEVVFGHRRLMAVKSLGHKDIYATVKELDDDTVVMMRATENVERAETSPIEEGQIYKYLYETKGLPVDEIGRKMGKSPGIIKRRMDLLKMPECLQKAIHKKEIGYAVGEALWSLGNIADIEYYLGFAIDHGATLEVVRQWVKDKKDEIRRAEGGTEGGRGDFSPMEKRPYYMTCDTCLKAMELGTEIAIRVCPVCARAISEGLKN